MIVAPSGLRNLHLDLCLLYIDASKGFIAQPERNHRRMTTTTSSLYRRFAEPVSCLSPPSSHLGILDVLISYVGLMCLVLATSRSEGQSTISSPLKACSTF